MKHFNQSTISEFVKPCSVTEAIKRKRDVFGIIGTSAVIAEPKPEGRPCPSARKLAPNNWVNSTKIRYQ